MSPADATATALKTWVVLARAQEALTELARKDVARHGLTLGEFGVLEALHHGGPMKLGEVQRKLLVSSGGVTWLVNRLTERRLTERVPCPDDRRATFVGLTAQGEALIARVFPEHAEMIRRAMGALTIREQQQLGALLKQLGHAAAGETAEQGQD